MDTHETETMAGSISTCSSPEKNPPMNGDWVLSLESWRLSTDIPMPIQFGRGGCEWTYKRHRVLVVLEQQDVPHLRIQIIEDGRPEVEMHGAGTPLGAGYVFLFHHESMQSSCEGYEQLPVRVQLTPDTSLKALFQNSPAGLSYMPVLRHFLETLQPQRVLEWGPGRSTLQITEALPDARVFAIEHNPLWFDKMRKIEAASGRLQLFHEPLTLSPGRSGKYVTAPLYWGESFDLIFIDGRLRTDCIAISRQVLRPGGVVLVHDAHRKPYHQAFRFFSSAQVVNNTVVLRS